MDTLFVCTPPDTFLEYIFMVFTFRQIIYVYYKYLPNSKNGLICRETKRNYLFFVFNQSFWYLNF